MIVATRGSLLRLLRWQKKNVLLFLGAATFVTALHEVAGFTWLRLPPLPVAVIGGALGIFVSFRTNSCYDRWWEGRKLWGRLVNTSRHLSIQLMRYATAEPVAASRIVRRHVAYVHTLRCLLREQDPLIDENVRLYIDARDEDAMAASSNATARLLDHQLEAIVALHRDGHLDGLQLQSIDASVRELLDVQGGCERIKKTPLPRAYGFIAQRMLQWFGALLPLAIVEPLGWAAVPVATLVALGFLFISETGRVLEDPFNMFWNGLPLSALSRTIERNCLELIGVDKKELPDNVQPTLDQVLM